MENLIEMFKYCSNNTASQMYVDKTIWSFIEHGIRVEMQIIGDAAYISLGGYGSCPPLIAKTQGEVMECVQCWLQHWDKR